MTSTTAFELSETFTAEGSQGSRPFVSLVQVGEANWELAPIGRLERKEVDGFKGQEVRFTSALNDKVYELGNFRTNNILDHGPIFEPLLRDGWEVVRHQTLRGGAKIATEFVHRDLALDDNISWDFTSAGGQHPELKDAKSLPSLMVLADARKGMQYSLTAGIHRLVCTNGLIAKVLDLGSMEFSHTIAAESATDKVAKFSTELLNGNRWNSMAYRTYQPAAAATLAGWLANPTEVPSLLKPSISTLDVWTTARREALVGNLDSIQEGFTVVDILNAITNVDQGIRTFWNLDRMATSLRDMAELAEWTVR